MMKFPQCVPKRIFSVRASTGGLFNSAHVRVKPLDNKRNKLSAEMEPALEEPHDDDVMGQADGVGVKLQGVGEPQGDGKDGQVVVVPEASENFGNSNQRG